jgi:DNA-binding XRE family transcriptional regulator
MFVMTHPAYLRDKARELRIAHGFTIDELAERLALPRGTIYDWVRDIPIARPAPNLSPAAHALATRAMQAKYRLARETAYAEGRATFPSLAADACFRDFVCLYLAEGYKRDRNRVSVCNSDPAVVRLCDAWLRRLSAKRRLYSIQYHADQEITALREFWAGELKITSSEIRMQRKSNSNQMAARTWRSEHGVLAVTVNDTLLRARLGAWMDGLREAWP